MPTYQFKNMHVPAEFLGIVKDSSTRQNGTARMWVTEAWKMQWDPDKRIPWKKKPRKSDAILEYERFPIYHVPEYWNRLSHKERVRFNRVASAYTLSQFMYAEALAVYICEKCRSMVDGVYDKGFLGIQIIEEQRHADVFRRYLVESLKEGIYPISEPLKTYLSRLSKEKRWHYIFIALHLIIESVGQAGLENMARYARDPLLKIIVTAIREDEKRHVEYGMFAVEAKVKGLSKQDRRELAFFAHDSLNIVSGRYFPKHAYEAVGFTPKEIKVISGLSSESSSRKHFRKRTIALARNNLIKLGLFDKKDRTIRERYEKSGLLELMKK